MLWDYGTVRFLLLLFCCGRKKFVENRKTPSKFRKRVNLSGMPCLDVPVISTSANFIIFTNKGGVT